MGGALVYKSPCYSLPHGASHRGSSTQNIKSHHDLYQRKVTANALSSLTIDHNQ